MTAALELDKDDLSVWWFASAGGFPCHNSLFLNLHILRYLLDCVDLEHATDSIVGVICWLQELEKRPYVSRLDANVHGDHKGIVNAKALGEIECKCAVNSEVTEE